MRRRRTAMFVAAVAGLGAARATADSTVIVLNSNGPGVLMRSDAPRQQGFAYGSLITGLEDDERVVAIDTLPGLGNLYGITAKRMYEIDPFNGDATPVGPRFSRNLADLIIAPAAFEFDPVTRQGWLVGPLYLGPGASATPPVSATIDPTSGALTDFVGDAAVDVTHFAYVEGDPAFGAKPNISGFACAGDVNGPASWTAFGIDEVRETLVRLGSPGGLDAASDDRDAVTTIGPLAGLPDGARPFGLEIDADGTGYTLAPDAHSGHTSLYRVDLSSGAATNVWDIGLVIARDLAVVPALRPLSTLVLDVKRAVVRYDFRSSRRPADSVTITGDLPYPTGVLAGKVVRVDVDGVVREFTLDARGRGVSGPDSFRLVGKPAAGRIRYSLVLRKAELQQVAGVQATTPTGPTRMTVDLYFGSRAYLLDGRAYRASVDLDYVARSGRGVAKTVKTP